MREGASIATCTCLLTKAFLILPQSLHGRNFSGQAVQAYIADGSERFKKSTERKLVAQDEDDTEEKKRLDEFGSWLEQEGKKEKDT